MTFSPFERAASPSERSTPSLFERATPLLFQLDPERAHRLSIRLARAGLHPRPRFEPDVLAPLAVEAAGLRFAHPLGLAAGYDKDAEAAEAMWRAGFGHVEVGTITPRPQPGNPRPRVFRLPEDRAVVNRYGFNSRGLEHARRRLERLRDRRPDAPPGTPDAPTGTPGAPSGTRGAPFGTRGVLGVNVGANKRSPDFAADYARGVAELAPLADYVTVNVSSPNTPGLRALQGAEPLADLVARVGEVAGETPVFLKIAPDLDARELDRIAEVANGSGASGTGVNGSGARGGLAGLIVSNTTTARVGLRGRHRDEAGGLSGRPLMEPSTRVLAAMFRRTALPLVGAGGVEDADTAWRKIEAGATLVQLYSALVYRGPGIAGEIVRGLAERCRSEGVGIRDVVGRRADAYRDP